MKTKFNKILWQRKQRAKNNNAYTKKYEKTINGFLMRLYRNMKERTDGTQFKKRHLYFGKELLPKEDFYSWAKSNKLFLKMFKYWEKNNYNRKLTPTIDRVDTERGYVLDNMRWLTHSENSKLGTISRNNKYGNPNIK